MHAIQRVMIVALLVTSGCASSGGTNRPNRNVITAEQIASARVQNGYEAVQSLQPEWLSSRGPTSVTDPTPTGVSVYVNGIQMGGAEALRPIGVDNIVEIRYYPAGQAGARFGMGHPRGVIEVTTRS